MGYESQQKLFENEFPDQISLEHYIKVSSERIKIHLSVLEYLRSHVDKVIFIFLALYIVINSYLTMRHYHNLLYSNNN